MYTVAGTASNGVDYATLVGSIYFPTGAATAEIDVTTLVNPPDDEPNETVVATLVDIPFQYTLGVGRQAIAVIGRDATNTLTNEVEIAAADPLGAELDTDPAAFEVTRAGVGYGTPITVAIAIGGTAVNGADYAALTNVVQFPAGVLVTSITVAPLVNDPTDEPAEDVLATARSGAGYTIGASHRAQVWIAPDGLPGGGTNQSSGDAAEIFAADDSASEISDPIAHLQVTRSGPWKTNSGVAVVRLSGTAVNGVDYRAIPGSVYFAPGDTNADVPVTILFNHPNDEPEETIVASILPLNYKAGPSASATITIAPDDTNIIYMPAGVYGDFNDDGHPDLMTQFKTGLSITFLTNGIPASNLPGLVSFYPRYRATALRDLSGDGYYEVVAQRGKLIQTLMLSNIFAFDFYPTPFIPMPSKQNVRTRILASGYFDGDADADLIGQRGPGIGFAANFPETGTFGSFYTFTVAKRVGKVAAAHPNPPFFNRIYLRRGRVVNAMDVNMGLHVVSNFSIGVLPPRAKVFACVDVFTNLTWDFYTVTRGIPGRVEVTLSTNSAANIINTKLSRGTKVVGPK